MNFEKIVHIFQVRQFDSVRPLKVLEELISKWPLRCLLWVHLLALTAQFYPQVVFFHHLASSFIIFHHFIIPPVLFQLSSQPFPQFLPTKRRQAVLSDPLRLRAADCAGRTLLMRAAQLGQGRLCSALLAAKAEVNATGGYMWKWIWVQIVQSLCHMFIPFISTLSQFD